MVALLGACKQGDIERPGPYYPPDPLDYSETPVGKHGQLSVNQDGKLVDESGELVQLKGVSSHWLNWETDGYALSYAALLWMRDNWNVSVIRAAMGVADGQDKPVSGGYLTAHQSMEYQVETIVENAKRLGVYVIIDWHDHYAQDHVEFAEYFFDMMAKRYKDYDNVIYEVFNEPLTREWNGKGPYTWSDDLKPYHEHMMKVIRRHDKHGVIVMGTPNWSQDIDIAAQDPVDGDNLMYTLHFYACTHQDWLWERLEPTLDANFPVFVTEWGATDASGGVDDKTVCVDSANTWHQILDEHSISWAAWKLDGCDEASCLLKQGAPVDGPWDDWTQGHGDYVVSKLKGIDFVELDGGVALDAAADAGPADGGGVDAAVLDPLGLPDAAANAQVHDGSVSELLDRANDSRDSRAEASPERSVDSGADASK